MRLGPGTLRSTQVIESSEYFRHVISLMVFNLPDDFPSIRCTILHIRQEGKPTIHEIECLALRATLGSAMNLKTFHLLFLEPGEDDLPGPPRVHVAVNSYSHGSYKGYERLSRYRFITSPSQARTRSSFLPPEISFRTDIEYSTKSSAVRMSCASSLLKGSSLRTSSNGSKAR